MQIRALLSKAKVHTIDIECPYCSELIEASESVSWSIYEYVPTFLKCGHCGKTSRTPKSVKGHKLALGSK